MFNIKKVLITGANGFVGTNLVKELIKDSSIQIRAMVVKNTPIDILSRFLDQSKNLEIVYGDLLDIDSLYNACEHVDIIVHLAGLVTDWAPKALYEKINVLGTKNLLLAADRYGIKRVIFMSSLTVHSLSGHYFDDETIPRDMKKMAYGISKIEAENLVEQWAGEKNERDHAIIRPGFIIYGPYDIFSFIKVLDSIIKGQFALLNGGKSLISYVYSENLAYGICQLIKAQRVDGPYIILDGNMSWKEWVNTWTNVAGCKPVKISVKYGLIAPFVYLIEKIFRLFKIKKAPPLIMYRIRIPRKDLAFKDDKMKAQIGYNPPVSFTESVNITLSYYKKSFKK